MSSNYNDAENYCKDCDRSIYGEYHNCDVNIENNGRYTQCGSPCYCKCSKGVGVVEIRRNGIEEDEDDDI